MKSLHNGILLISLLALSSAAFSQDPGLCPSGDWLVCGSNMHVYNYSTSVWKVKFEPTNGSVKPSVFTLTASNGSTYTRYPIRYCGAGRVIKSATGKVIITDPQGRSKEMRYNQERRGPDKCPMFVANCGGAVAYNTNPNGPIDGGDITVGPFKSWAEAEEKGINCWKPGMQVQ